MNKDQIRKYQSYRNTKNSQIILPVHWKVLVERRFRRDLLEKGISGTRTFSPAQISEENDDIINMLVMEMITIAIMMIIMIIMLNTTW